jgi:Tfp pilus assembly protein PilX
MRTVTPRLRARGSMLVVAMILLAVLSVLGVSAVLLSSEERRNASSKARRDALEACARGAQAQVWAEVARYGPTYLKSGTFVAAPDTLPGGMSVRAPAHYSDATINATPDGGDIRVDSVVVQFDQGVSDGSVATASDLTNRAVAIDQLGSGKAYRVVARCRDGKARELEVEFSMRFTLF